MIEENMLRIIEEGDIINNRVTEGWYVEFEAIYKLIK